MNFIHKIFLTLKTIHNIPLLMGDYLHLIEGDVTYKTTNGIQFFARAGSPDIREITVVTSGKNYPLGLVTVPKNPIVLDLGAHIGSFSLFAAKYFEAIKPTILAFEPEEENFSYLKRNIRLNHAEKTVHAEKKAISTHSGTEFLVTTSLNNDAYYLSKTKKGEADQPTKTITLSRIMENYKIQHFDILKMDIEGAEYKILNDPQTQKIISHRVTNAFIEVHSSSLDNIRWLKRILPKFRLRYNNDHVILLTRRNEE